MVGGHHLVPFLLQGLVLLDRPEPYRGAYGDLGGLGSQDVVADRDGESPPARDRAVARSRVDEHGIPGEAFHDDLDRGLGGSRWGPSMSAGLGSRSPGPRAEPSGSSPGRLDQGADPPRPPKLAPGPALQATPAPAFAAHRSARPGLEHSPLVEPSSSSTGGGAASAPFLRTVTVTSRAIRTAPPPPPSRDSGGAACTVVPDRNKPRNASTLPPSPSHRGKSRPQTARDPLASLRAQASVP